MGKIDFIKAWEGNKLLSRSRFKSMELSYVTTFRKENGLCLFKVKNSNIKVSLFLYVSLLNRMQFFYVYCGGGPVG